MLKIILISTTLASVLATTTASALNLRGQAGDINQGAAYELTKDSIASYYKTGKSGQVTFKCELYGNEVKALLYGGKNFALSVPRILKPGTNGEYTWHLHKLGDDVGNIKVKLIKGVDAYVRCVATR